MNKRIFYFLIPAVLCCPHMIGAKVTNLSISSGGKIDSGGPVKFVSIGEPIAGAGRSGAVGVGFSYTGRKAAGDSRSAPVSVKAKTLDPSSEFKLGEVSVSPNPAKGGEAPVFHIETGIADSVNIKIRTVSGLVTHERAITGMPQVLDKGGNTVYAYEYTWEGRIAGGLYHYTIEAVKAGQKLEKSGTFAVMR